MVKIITGNIFNSNADAIAVPSLRRPSAINTVNCVGVMGKGLALNFKRRYPEKIATPIHCVHRDVSGLSCSV